MNKTIAQLQEEERATFKAWMDAKRKSDEFLAPLNQAWTDAMWALHKAKLRAEVEAELHAEFKQPLTNQ